VKRLRFKEEAGRLGVPVEAVAKASRNSLDEGKIWGVMDADELISFTPQEIENLTGLNLQSYSGCRAC